MKLLVYSQRDKSQTYDLQAQVFTPSERVKRSLLRFFAFMGLAVVSILIPVLHFVLVPVFALIAPFIAYKSYQEEVTIDRCQLPCPECSQLVDFEKTSGRWPLKNFCPHCRNRIYFDKLT